MRIRSFVLGCSVTAMGVLAHAAPSAEIATVPGTLNVRVVDDPKGGRAAVEHNIEDARTKRRYRLQFPAGAPKHLVNGDQIIVRGRKQDETLRLEANGTEGSAIEVTSAAADLVSGEQRTLVMVGNFSNAVVECSVGEIREQIFDHPNQQSVADLFRETSHGATWLSGDVIGAHTIAHTNADCAVDDWADALDANAATNGYDPSAYDRRVYILPPNACPAAGIADLGGSNTRAWSFVCHFADVVAHELGHNIGLMHASTLAGEYGDNTGLMGISSNQLRHVNAPHKEKVGWMQGAQIQMVESSGTYSIAAFEPDPGLVGAPQILKIPAASGEHLYVSYRRPLGFDSNLPSHFLERLSVHRFDGGYASNSVLLAILPDGNSYTDSLRGVTITQVDHGDQDATVEISFDGAEPVCQRATPAISLNPAHQAGDPGDLLSYTATVHNRDSAACDGSNISISAVLPGATWSAWLDQTQPYLQPGSSVNVGVTIASPADADPSAYGFDVVATHGSDSQLAERVTASYSVRSLCQSESVEVSVGPASQTSAPGAHASFAVAVRDRRSDSCPEVLYELDLASVPTPLSASIQPRQISLFPGASGSATLNVAVDAQASDGAYVVAIEVGDGERSSSATAMVDVQSVGADSQAPTVPTALKVSAKRKHVQLNWNSSTDNMAVAGYEVWRNGSRVATTGTNSYTDRAVDPTSKPAYQISAYDAAGNVSGLSAEVTVTVNDSGSGGGRGKGRNK